MRKTIQMSRPAAIHPGIQSQRGARQAQGKPGSAAADHVDALTVVMHEMGHALGLPDKIAGIMSESLAPGMRNVPTAADVGAAFASGRL
jgi:hypothetical protein